VSLSLSFNNILAFIINCNACVLLLSLVSVWVIVPVLPCHKNSA
jgi:hypothetical protein